MKSCVLTPTFSGHFQYLPHYLSSFEQLVDDKQNCIIIFIISQHENEALQNILRRYPNVPTQTVFFDDILQKYNIPYTPDELLEKYEKFSFQALKKFYGMLYLEEYEHFLVLDTETIWLNPTNMEKLFKEFFSNPKIIYSNNKKRFRISASNAAVTRNINHILHSKEDKWFVEQYLRFWDVNILKDIFKKCGSPIEIVQKLYRLEYGRSMKLGLFESVLYDQWIYENNNRYHYQLIDLDKECEKYLTPEVLKDYRRQMAKIWKGSCGLLESSSILLNQENYQGLAALFKNNHLNVIRIETEPQNYIWQKKFLDIVKPEILTCSQDNLFGANKTLKNAFLIYVQRTPAAKHFQSLLRSIISPLLPFAKWVKDLIVLLWLALKLIANFFLSFRIWI